MWKYKKEVKSQNSLIYFFYLDEYLGQLTMSFYAIIDVSIIVYANIFPQGPKKILGYTIVIDKFFDDNGICQYFRNIGEEYFVYVNKNV